MARGLASVRIAQRRLRRLGERVTESFYIQGRRLLGATVRLGGTVALAAMRPAAGAVSAGLRLERAARGAGAQRLSDAALTALDAALVSPVAEEAVDRAMEGSRLMGIMVCSADDGSILRPRRAAFRFACLVLVAIPLLAGFLPIMFDDRRRGLHDMLAATVVVESPRLS